MAGQLDGMQLLFGGDAGQAQPVADGATPLDGMKMLFGDGATSALPHQAKPAEPGNIISRTWDTIKGRQDPKYADVPRFDDGALAPVLSTAIAKFGGANNKAYADVVQSSLGDRFIRRFKDANDYDIIEYKGADGKPTMAYPKKPGLDFDDVNSAAMQGLGFLGAGKIAKAVGGPLLARGAAQMAAAGATSVAGDLASTAVGSKQGIDPYKAGLAAGTAGASELIPGKVLAPLAGAAIGAGATFASGGDARDTVEGGVAGGMMGYAANVLARRFLGMTPGLYVKDGKLTDRGIKAATEAAKQNGQDPAEFLSRMTGEVADTFGKNYALSRDAARSGIMADAGPIPLSKGQRSGNFQDLAKEDAYFAGLHGPEAQSEMAAFRARQKGAVEAAIYDGPTGMSGRPVPPPPPAIAANAPPGVNGRPQMGPTAASTAPQSGRGLGATLNPDRAVTQGVSQAELGTAAREGLEQSREGGRAVERAAWENVGDLHTTPEASQLLPKFISDARRPTGIDPDPELTPIAMKMGQVLESFMKGEKQKPVLDVFGPNDAARTIESMSKTLGKMKRSIAPDNAADQTLAGALHDGFKAWASHAADQKLLAGDVASYSTMRAATAISAEVKGTFMPRFKGVPTAGARRIEMALEKADSPEAVLRAAIGDVSMKSTVQSGQLEAVTNIKRALATYGDKDVGRQTWNDLRLARLNQMVLGKDGQLATEAAIAQNFKRAEANQGSLQEAFFTPQEREFMRRLAIPLEKIGYRPTSQLKTNASGSGFVMATMAKEMLQNLFSAVGGKSKLVQTFAGPAVKPFLNSNAAAGAREAVDQTVQQVIPSLGGYGGAAGGIASR